MKKKIWINNGDLVLVALREHEKDKCDDILKYNDDAKQLAHGLLDKTVCISGHGKFQEMRPSRREFQAIHENLQTNNGSWEAFWISYLLFRCYSK